MKRFALDAILIVSSLLLATLVCVLVLLCLWRGGSGEFIVYEPEPPSEAGSSVPTEPPSRRYTFEGVVVNEQGEPIPGAKATIFTSPSSAWTPSATAQCDAEGLFRLTVPSTSEVGMEVWHDGYEQYSAKVAAPQELPTRITLRFGAQLEIVVTLRKEASFREVEYLLSNEDGSWGSSFFLEEGRAFSSGLREGRFELRLLAEGKLLAEPRIVELLRNETTRVEVNLP